MTFSMEYIGVLYVMYENFWAAQAPSILSVHLPFVQIEMQSWSTNDKQTAKI